MFGRVCVYVGVCVLCVCVCMCACVCIYDDCVCVCVYVLVCSLHDRVVKKGVSFLRGNVSIITSSDLSHMHVISMNVILPPRRREG